MAHIGRRVSVGIAKEDSRGSGADPTFWMPKTSFDHVSVADKIVDEESRNSIRSNVSQYTPLKRAEGTLEANMRANALGLLLYNIFGEVSSSPSDGAHEHTFTLEESNTHQSLALTMADPVQQYMFNLVMLESLSISIETGEFATISAEFRSKQGEETSQTVDFENNSDEHIFHSRHAEVKFAATVAGLNSANGTAVKSLEINFNKQAIDEEAVHSVEPLDIFNRQFSVDGTLEFKYEDKEMRNRVLEDEMKAMRIEFENDQIDVGDTHPGLKLDMAKVGFDEWERTSDLDEIVDQTVTFVPYANPQSDAGYFDSVVLTNDVENY